MIITNKDASLDVTFQVGEMILNGTSSLLSKRSFGSSYITEWSQEFPTVCGTWSWLGDGRLRREADVEKKTEQDSGWTGTEEHKPR